MKNLNEQLKLALSFHKNNNINKALKIYLELYEFEKNNLNLLYLIGTSYIQIKKLEISIFYLESALKINNNHYQTLNNLGGVYFKLNKTEKAVTIFEKLLRINSNENTKNNLANCYAALNRNEKALNLYQEITKNNSKDYVAFNNIGNVYKSLGNYDKAIVNYKCSIKINKNYVLAYNNLGELFREMGLYENALKMYQNVINIEPEYKNIYGKILHAKKNLCDWEDYHNLKVKVLDDVKNLKEINPFTLLSLIDDPKLQKTCSENFINKKFPNQKISMKKKLKLNKKTKIAYFSSDFKNHPILHLCLDTFKNHNRSKFEVFGFSLLKHKKDEWNKDIENYFDKLFYVHDKSDYEISKFCKKIGIDIAIDLNGFTKGGRQGIFIQKCAPIQINFLGYPGTMGSKVYDYIIADKIIIPETKKNSYCEKVIYLKNCYQPNIDEREISNKILKKSDFNLPEDKLIYCNFNTSYKITPEMFKTWMQILKKVPSSIFWIYSKNKSAEKNIIKEAISNNIDEKRIIFARRTNIQEHLNRIKLGDIFLDTYPYGAHTSCSDALRIGLPLITIKGESFASRVSASLLNRVNLDELVVSDYESYIKLAIKLGKNKEYLTKLKKNLFEKLKKTSLFDNKEFTKNLENTYEELLKNYAKN